ncbi:MAG: bifunctional homocysteine S-methyltransferase/methylenetetrahydrofolate reductase [Acidobacteriota bacterium]
MVSSGLGQVRYNPCAAGGTPVSKDMRRTPPFLEQLERSILVCDGAMGTYLYGQGVPFGHCFPEQNLKAPDLIERIHRRYAGAGADILESNTYTANRLQLERFGLDDRVRQLNIKGCRIARQAAEGRCYIAGSVGPLGKVLQPLGPLSYEEAVDIFRQQIEALAEGGADLIMIETISDLEEMDAALEAARSACDLPIVVQKTFTEDGRTLMGELPHEVVARAEAGGAQVVGANCTVGPQRMLDIIERMAVRATVPLIAQPTAGLPRLVDGHISYFAEPDYMAYYGVKLVQAGARIVGACCGSTPEHTKAIAGALGEVELRPARASVQVVEAETREREPVPVAQRSSLARRLGHEFTITVDLALPRGHDLEATLRQAERFGSAGVDAVVLSDSVRARLCVHPVVAAYRLYRDLKLESVLVYASRDRNVLGIQSDLLGAHVLGLRNVMVSPADPANIGDYPTATTLYDVDRVGLMKILDSMNRGLDLAGNPIGEPTAFFPMALANPTAHDLDRELVRLGEQVEAGAAALVTTPQFDLQALNGFLDRVSGFGVPLIVGLLPLRSARHADFLHNEVPGMRIPEAVRERLAKVADPAVEGCRIARDLLAVLPQVVAGAHILPPYQNSERACAVLDELEISTVRGLPPSSAR